MPSKSLTSLAVISLLLFMATCVIWVRSYFTKDYFHRDVIITQHEVRNYDRRAIGITSGALILIHRRERDSSDVWEAHNYGETNFTNRTEHHSYTTTSVKYPYVSEPFFGVSGPVNGEIFRMAGFQWAFFQEPQDHRYRVLEGRARFYVTPLWAIALVTGTMPMVVVMRWRRRWQAAGRQLKGLCASCGYDLRATPDRCPECGALSINMKCGGLTKGE